MNTVDLPAYDYRDLFLQILMDGRQVWRLVRARFLSLTRSLLVKAVYLLHVFQQHESQELCLQRSPQKALS